MPRSVDHCKTAEEVLEIKGESRQLQALGTGAAMGNAGAGQVVHRLN